MSGTDCYLPRLPLRVPVVLALLAIALSPIPAKAQGASEYVMQMMRSTPDLAVTATATANFTLPGGAIRWIFLKNDCAKPLYFDLDGLDRYPLKLLQNQSFSGNFRVNSVRVSPDNTGTACTFTAIGGR